MDRDEKIAMKAACIQAAATLVAGVAQPPQSPQLGRNSEEAAADTGNCARFARDLFGKLTGEPWD
jgi:hypothetical protein